ncbi:MAG: ligase-associated DNA damage response exonuclease [Burkholderiaceae bacterium]|nr:ligase-associated DNA damage response exonuclease [Burkholderiaceae bacterium]MDP4949702.1 ligase-associated DNA damage response exonuclease [Burkholderiaceae bacterium]
MNRPAPLVVRRPEGLYCPQGDFFIDPWRPVDRAVITHGHADHARPGHGHALCSMRGLPVLRARLGEAQSFQGLGFGQRLRLQDVWVSLHPASHVLGASQVLIESASADGHGSERWLVSGDYRVQNDPSCDAFEPVKADVFISETTFGLPIYRWPNVADEVALLLDWWQTCRDEGRAAVLYTYALGKAQRLLIALLRLAPLPGTLFVHPSVARMNEAYREAGIALPELPTPPAMLSPGAMVLAPMAVQGSGWMQRQRPALAEAMVSGWMLVRGHRRRHAGVRGFVISDHADWPGLLWAIDQTQASRVVLTHGQTSSMARYLKDQGRDVDTLETEFDAQAADV